MNKGTSRIFMHAMFRAGSWKSMCFSSNLFVDEILWSNWHTSPGCGSYRIQRHCTLCTDIFISAEGGPRTMFRNFDTIGGVLRKSEFRSRLIEAWPVFVNLLRSPGTDTQPGAPVRQAVPASPRNRFLGPLIVYMNKGSVFLSTQN